MIEPPGDLGRPSKGQVTIDRRTWSQERQWRAAGLATAVVIISILGEWLGGRVFAPHDAPVAAPSPPGTFRATPQQLKTLTVGTVQTHGFVSEELTEGKIGVNGDSATAVLYQYYGRGTRGIAGRGD